MCPSPQVYIYNLDTVLNLQLKSDKHTEFMSQHDRYRPQTNTNEEFIPKLTVNNLMFRVKWNNL